MEADSRFLSIVFTLPDPIMPTGEGATLTLLLLHGIADRVHIRKPSATAEQIAALLSHIPVGLHPRLRLHDHFELLERFPHVGGVHLNRRNPVAPEGVKNFSGSCHTIEELYTAYPGAEYVTLSPIFDSISKRGYTSAFDIEQLPKHLAIRPVIALGGVRAEHFSMLNAVGFAGAAMLGYIWPQYITAIKGIRKHLKLVRNFSLHFITDATTPEGATAQALAALEGGCRWIQVRMKGADDASVEQALRPLLQPCMEQWATLLVDDNVHLAKKMRIGVHLGKNDMPVAEARAILGDRAIIGVTCNTLEDMEQAIADGVADYIGLGPYRFTTTKKNLAKVLGIWGYRYMMPELPVGHIPVVAIGGITTDDVEPLLQAGVQGVAVSGAIAHADEPVAATHTFVDEISKAKYKHKL